MQLSTFISPAAVRLALRHPFWTEVFYSLTVKEALPGTPGASVDTLATDGRSLYVNRPFYESKPLDEQVTMLVHELGHKIFLHCTRRGARDGKLWNIAADFAINGLMKQNGFTIPSTWLYDQKYEGWLAEAIYEDLKKQAPEKRPQLGAGLEDIMEPQNCSPEEIEQIEAEIQSMVERAVASARAMGHLPAGIAAEIARAYVDKREPWYNHLHRYMQSIAVNQYSWARLNRRALITHKLMAPLHYSEALGDIALFIDTSGSCFDRAQQQNFAGHLNAILSEAKPRRVVLYYFDAKVYPGEEIQAGELDVETKPRGGGGTNFCPIFDQLEEDGVVPEVCIILTDLEGRFPSVEPAYPVVWANILPRGEAPFGETIHLAD